VIHLRLRQAGPDFECPFLPVHPVAGRERDTRFAACQAQCLR
jgi:hypothetical protein